MRVLYRMLIKDLKQNGKKKIFCLLKDLDDLGFWEMVVLDFMFRFVLAVYIIPSLIFFLVLLTLHLVRSSPLLKTF